MSKNKASEARIETAKQAVNAVWSDKYLSFEDAIEGLEEIISDAKSCIDALREDIRNRDK